MGKAAVQQLQPVRFENGKAMVIAGIGARYTAETMPRVSVQWRRLADHLGKIPGQVGRVTYGVMTDQVPGTGGIGYLSGVEVGGTAALPTGFIKVRLPAQLYAVFAHHGHVSTISSTVDAIWRHWLPGSGHTPTGHPDFFERYGEAFDPAAGRGDIEVWVPIKSA